MRMPEIIAKKRNGKELVREEIDYWIKEYVKETIPDYQTAALLMAIYFQGLSDKETVFLTEAMINSGEQVDLTGISGMKADKHSTGGVGDKTTLVFAPLAAAAGIKIAKMSGRGLGHTGGTLDKLESIPGFSIHLSPEEFLDQVNQVGLAVIGQTGDLVPADKKLYALRDVTGTVESLSLIASSVMSKKLAAGAEIIILDVKYGSGAFMKIPEAAVELARTMVKIGSTMGKKVAAVISSMDRPLGQAVGNALEVREAVGTLQGQGPSDLRKLCLVLVGELFYLSGKTAGFSEGLELAEHLLDNGNALAKFQQFVSAQGGNPDIVCNEKLLPEAKFRFTVMASRNGFIRQIETQSIGLAAVRLGAGRNAKDDMIDPAVGIVFYKKTGDGVEEGDTLAMIHANDEKKAEEAREMILKSIVIDDSLPPEVPLIYGIVSETGLEKLDEK